MLLKIGDFSKLAKISIRMLRYYDQIGILVPHQVDPITGYRHYSPAQLTDAARIHALREMGFSLSVVAEILQNYPDAPALKQYLQIKQTELLDQAKRTEHQLLLLTHTLEQLERNDTAMQYSVIEKELPERDVISLRRIIPTYQQEGQLWEELGKVLEAQKVQLATPCYSSAVFHDEGYKEQDVDVEIQLSVSGSYKNAGDVIFKTVPAIHIASVIFQGGYDQIAPVNQAIAHWITNSAYEMGEGMFNIYHVSPGTDPNPENWVTEVCYPLQKK